MTLDEAIEHAKDVARTCNDSACAADHMQLAEWLRQARGAESAARWYTAKLREAEAENAKLKEELEAVGTAAYLYGRSDLKIENAKLRELVKAAWGCVHSGVDCYECRVVAGGCTLQSAMRELGVEVGV